MYLDLLMILNFLIDYLLLLATNRIFGCGASNRRIIPAAVLGAIYGGGCMITGFGFLRELHWRIISLMLMSLIAFGYNRDAWRRCGVFVILCLALGGLALLFEKRNLPGLFFALVTLYCLIKLAFDNEIGGNEYVPVEISNGEKKLKLLALRDTGNHLRDPISGEQVMILADREACMLTGLTEKQLSTPLDTIASNHISGLRLIPYRTVGQRGNMMLAMRFSNVRINGRKRPTVVAFAPTGLGGNMYQALVGGLVL